MRKLLLITLSILTYTTTYAQNISTVAGNGSQGYAGDGSAATSANFFNPSGVAVDGSNNIYIVDAGNQRIRKVSASTGIISTIAGNGTKAYGGDGSTATSANLNNPSGVAVDDSGNIYIADVNNHRIRKVNTSTGIISTVAGNGTLGYGGDGSTATSANLNYPSGIAVDDSGNIYIADEYNYRIRKVSASTGIISTVAGNGAYGYGGDGSAATSANLYNPNRVAVDVSGNIYIADQVNYRIRKVSASIGIITTVAGNGTYGYGGDGSAATSAKLSNSNGVAVDGSGNIYIADIYNNRIRKVSASTGIITTVAGNGAYGYGGDGSAATSANLYNPNGVVVDSSGNLYIADTYNNRIRLVNYSIVNNIISNSQTICAGSAPVSITGSTPTGNTSSNTYSWLSSTTSAIAGFTAISSTNTINYSPGVLTQNKWFRRYVVSGTLTDTSKAVAITVNNAISSNIITGTAQTICSGSIPAPITATTATGGNGTIYNYKWLKSITSANTGYANAGGNDSIQNFTLDTLTQTIWFKRRVSSGVCNADTTAALLVTVNPIPAITNSSTASICSGTSTNLTLVASTPSTYAWTIGTNTGSITGASASSGSSINQILNNPSNAIAGSIVYNVTPTSTTGSCVGSPTAISVTINPTPIVGVILGQKNGLFPSTTYDYAVTQQLNVSYNWIITNGIIVSGQGTNVVNVKCINTSQSKLTVNITDSQGCRDTSFLGLFVGNVGNNELKVNNQVIIYPNPFNETIYVSLLNNLGLNKAILYDLLGKEILTTHKSEIDVKELKSGVYLMMVIDNNGNNYSQKLIKN